MQLNSVARQEASNRPVLTLFLIHFINEILLYFSNPVRNNLEKWYGMTIQSVQQQVLYMLIPMINCDVNIEKGQLCFVQSTFTMHKESIKQLVWGTRYTRYKTRVVKQEGFKQTWV